jgi:hypothetical protein
MTKLNKLSSFLAFSCLLFSFQANASSFEMSLVGLMDSSSLNVSNTPSTLVVNGATVSGISTSSSAKIGPGGGILFDSKLVPEFGFEFGALYITRKVEQTTSFTFSGISSSQSSTTTSHYLEIPLLLRIWLSPYVSIGAGGYYAKGLGSIDPSIKSSDYGAVGSLGLHLPLGSSSSLLIDGRYNLGLKNVDNSGMGQTMKYRDLQIIAGLTFGFGGKH